MRRIVRAGWFMLVAVACAAVFGASSTCAAADPARYVAGWLDGTTTTGGEVRDWGNSDGHPELAGRRLFEGAPALRWLRDTQLLPAAQPTAFVEFFGGDTLPGKVTGFQSAVELPQIPEPACLLVETPQPWLVAAEPRALRVWPDEIRRVVWQRRSANHYQPATLFYRDGRRQPFRSLRWADTGVRLLLDQGTSLVPWEQIAELHLPARPAWSSWLDALAHLSPNVQSRLVQLETIDGLRLTTSIERYRAQAMRDANKPDNWQHFVQPAWSPDRLLVPHTKIRLRVWFEPHEAPLSSLEPAAHRARHTLGGAWREPRTDANVQGTAMRCGGRLAAWGWGVQAHDELLFELPPVAATFRTQFGLDDLVGTGGYARGRVTLTTANASAGARPTVLFETPIRQGAGAAEATSPIPLTPASSTTSVEQRLALVVDSLDQPGVRGADPLDVRDVWNWFEPLVELDRAALTQLVAKHAIETIPGLSSWLGDTPEKRVDVVQRLAPTPDGGRTFRVCFIPREGSLKFSRKLTITAERPSLCLLLSHPEAPVERSSRLIVRVEDRQLYDGDVPVWREGRLPLPVKIALNDFTSRDVRVEVTITSPARPAAIVWHGVEMITK
ncbi:MAG: hypothetical protein JSS27_18185 [Planctomycetes bacterium]|nr:hypothetical protein [Planctomycetota bacterium]